MFAWVKVISRLKGMAVVSLGETVPMTFLLASGCSVLMLSFEKTKLSGEDDMLGNSGVYSQGLALWSKWR